ncbi:apoptosis-associated speck-like protein containing a CARD [Puntigrus tetrazona]|uniref:apoptosis-associated speck-like protein containing a CARD n=1 Tax=Puntigrus tetrazona TaxID=1606681 RepID=UPI001C8A2F0A|nr:apoptosis-associated speck-like protein containing a CARD [Puntigrus tetrazona]
MMHNEKYAEIKKERTDQDRMRKLLESLTTREVKKAFYYLLEENEEHLFKELGGVSRKRKLSDPECSVPCKRLNTGINQQDNHNIAGNSAALPANINTVNRISIEQRSLHNMSHINIINKTERKPHVPKKEKKTITSKKEKKPLAIKKEKKTPAPKKEKRPPAIKKEKKTPAPKKKKTTAPKKKSPAHKIKKTPAPKKKKTPAPKKKKTPVHKIKKTPAPKKKTPAPKKKKTPTPKKKTNV